MLPHMVPDPLLPELQTPFEQPYFGIAPQMQPMIGNLPDAFPAMINFTETKIPSMEVPNFSYSKRFHMMFAGCFGRLSLCISII